MAGRQFQSGGVFRNSSGTARQYQSGGVFVNNKGSGGATYPESYAGSCTPAGVLTYSVAKSLAGGITAAGALANQTQKPLAASSTASGSLAKLAATSLAGSATGTGSLANQTQKPLAASSTPAGTLSTTKATYQAFAGSVTPAGNLANATAKVVAGSIQLAGILNTTGGHPSPPPVIPPPQTAVSLPAFFDFVPRLDLPQPDGYKPIVRRPAILRMPAVEVESSPVPRFTAGRPGVLALLGFAEVKSHPPTFAGKDNRGRLEFKSQPIAAQYGCVLRGCRRAAIELKAAPTVISPAMLLAGTIDPERFCGFMLRKRIRDLKRQRIADEDAAILNTDPRELGKVLFEIDAKFWRELNAK